MIQELKTNKLSHLKRKKQMTLIPQLRLSKNIKQTISKKKLV